MEVVNWRQTAQDKDGQEQLGERLFFLKSGTIFCMVLRYTTDVHHRVSDNKEVEMPLRE